MIDKTGFDDTQIDEDDPRYLMLGDAPRLTGETAHIIIQLLNSLIDEIASEYEPELAARWRREELRRYASRDPRAPWQSTLTEQQLPLELDENEQSL